MTAEQVREKINNRDPRKLWESVMYVDSVTYANCCQYLFDKLMGLQFPSLVILTMGPNGGIMFKGVELVHDETIDPL